MRARRGRTPSLSRGPIASVITFAVLTLGASSAVAAEETRLTVVGVVIPDRGVSLAAIEDGSGNRTRFFRIGDKVSGGVVTTIQPDRVTIAFEGQPVLFRLAGVPALSDEPRTPRTPPSRGRTAVVAHGPSVLTGLYGRVGALVKARPRPRADATRDDTASGGATGGGGGGGTPSVGGSAGDSASTLQFIGVLHGGSQQPGDTFAAQSLRDLLITVTHPTVSATTQRIELSAPDGSLYQKYSGAAMPASQVRVPIGGTWITEHGLFGAWSVRVYLDHSPTPSITGGFVLSR